MTSYHSALFLFVISLTCIGVESKELLSNYELKPVSPMIAPPLDSREEESVPEPLKAFSWVLPAALSSSNYSNSNKNPHPQESYQRQNVHHSSSTPREKQVDPSRFLTRIYHTIPVTYSSSVQVSRPSLPKTSRRTSSSPEASASSPGRATSSFYSFAGPDPGYGYGSESQGQIPSHYGHGSSPYSYSGPNGYAYSGPGGKGHTRYYSSPDGNSHSSSYSHSYSDNH